MGTFRPDTGEGETMGKGAIPLSNRRKYCNYRAIVKKKLLSLKVKSLELTIQRMKYKFTCMYKLRMFLSYLQVFTFSP